MLRVFVAFTVLFAAVSCYEKDGDVLVLTDATIDEAIKEFPFLLIEFYAPWCGHCKTLAPEYSKAATKLAGLESPVPIAKVDATENSEAASKFGVRGYPTLKWFVNGKDSEYGGGRTAAEIVNWIKKKVGNPTKALAAASDVEAFKNGADVVVVGFVAQGSAEYSALENAGRAIEDVEIGVVHDAAVAAELGFSIPSVVLFKNFDEGKSTLEGEVSAASVEEFVKANSLPIISTFSQETAPKLFGSGIESHFLYFNSKDSSSHEGLLASLKPVASEFKGKTLFVFVPETETRVLQYFDLTADDVPAAVLVAMGEGDMKKFALTTEITTENVRAHVTAFHNGELKPTLKSEEIPENNNGPVKVIVGKNFNDIVMDETKDVLVEFYAPWCGHCKSLAPVWEELGTKFAHHNNIVIAKVDSTANDIDHPAISVKGFPTIIFFPANGKDAPKTYEGGRDLESFVSYLEKHATVDLEAKHDHAGHDHAGHDHVDL